MEAKHHIHLSADELGYLNRLAAHDRSLATLVKSVESTYAHGATIRLSANEAEKVRDQLTMKLAASGFDDEYAPTELGLMLEKLIDKFCVR
jgi:hypothetical protein